MGLGREAVFRLGHHPALDRDRLHVSVAAIRLSARVNAVSRRHGEESRRIWAPLWPDREAARVPITDITNGVHVATWMPTGGGPRSGPIPVPAGGHTGADRAGGPGRLSLEDLGS